MLKVHLKMPSWEIEGSFRGFKACFKGSFVAGLGAVFDLRECCHWDIFNLMVD